MIDNSAPSGLFNHSGQSRLYQQPFHVIGDGDRFAARHRSNRPLPRRSSRGCHEALELAKLHLYDRRLSRRRPENNLTTVNQGGNLYTYTTDYFQINTGTGAFENGRSYVVHEVMTDKAGNTFSNVHAAFTYDVLAPTSTIQSPLNGLSAIKSLPSMSGIASDNFANNNVQVAIYGYTEGAWFDGVGFNVPQTTPSYVNVTSTNSTATIWSYAPANLDLHFQDARQYLVLSRAIDVAGNAQSNLVIGVSSNIITMDRTPPVITVTGGFPTPRERFL